MGLDKHVHNPKVLDPTTIACSTRHEYNSYALMISLGIQAGLTKSKLRVLALTTISLCRNEQQGGAT